MQWVCYLEVQGFYAAAARQTGAVPTDRPTVVLHEGHVVDGCREAFTAGLMLGSPARRVLRDVPQAVCIDRSQLEVKPFAHAWWDRCLAHTPYLEPVEPHKILLVLPVPGQAVVPALRTEVARLQELSAAYGFAAFAGVGASRLVAQAAAESCRAGWLQQRPGLSTGAGPASAAFVLPGEEARFLADLPVSYLPASPAVLQRLQRLGMRRIGEVAQVSEAEWVRQLGPEGRQVASWSRGVDPEPVRPCYPPRILAHREAFTPDLRSEDRLEQVVNRLAAALARRLAEQGEGCQQVALTLELSGGARVENARTLAKLQQAPYPLQQALQRLLRQALQEAAAVSAAGQAPAVSAVTVSLSLIGPMPWRQLNLWDDSGQSEREERLQQALLLLQERFPSRLVRLGLQQDLSWRERMLQFVDPFRWVPN